MFEDVYGQTPAREYLARIVEEDRLPNGVLIYGPPKTGKFVAAMTLARAINCRQQRHANCQCPSCVKIRESCHSDVRVIKPNDKDNINIEQIRLEIKAPFEYRVNEGKRKIAVIKNADLMQVGASNALLKVLEEPLGDATLILTSSKPDAILDTIKSRCQLIRFSFLDTKVLEYLSERDSQETDPIALEVMGGVYEPSRIQDELQLLRHVFDFSEVELPEKIEADALRNELFYLGCVFAYMQRNNLYTFGRVMIQRANSDKFQRLFAVTEQALDYVVKGVKPYLVIKSYVSQIREITK